MTAMHGVGAKLGTALLEKVGFEVSLALEQAEPDPDFPTVSFPNPEEPGALDLGKAHAEKTGPCWAVLPRTTASCMRKRAPVSSGSPAPMT